MDQPKFTSRTRSISNDFFCHTEINYFMSPNMQIILLNERCLTSQIQLICKCKPGFICDILYGWEKTKRLLNSNTNCSDWLSHIIIHTESSKYQNSDKKCRLHKVRLISPGLFKVLFLDRWRLICSRDDERCVPWIQFWVQTLLSSHTEMLAYISDRVFCTTRLCFQPPPVQIWREKVSIRDVSITIKIKSIMQICD